MTKIIQIVKALKNFFSPLITAAGNFKVAIQEDALGLAKSEDVSKTQPRNVAQWGGVALTGRDVSGDLAKLQNLDILLSALRDTLKLNEPVNYLPSAARTANGDTTATPLNTDYASVLTFFLDVTAVSGTTPTLDVYIDIQDPLSGKWVNQDKFPQVTTTGTWALAVYCRSNRYAIRWVLGGTTPSFTFSVGVVKIK